MKNVVLKNGKKVKLYNPFLVDLEVVDKTIIRQEYLFVKNKIKEIKSQIDKLEANLYLYKEEEKNFKNIIDYLDININE